MFFPRRPLPCIIGVGGMRESIYGLSTTALRPMLRQGDYAALPPFGALLFHQWLDVTRASDPPVPCGHRDLPCSLRSQTFFRAVQFTLSILTRKWKASYAAGKQKHHPDRVFVDEVQSYSRDIDSVIV